MIVPRPPRIPAPVIFPSAIWKTPANVYRPPIDKNPFFNQNNQLNKPYEFINNEPALSINAPAITNTIKQVGEKGPIHTIPAPNLSPADKPAVIREEIPHKNYHFKEQEISANSIQSNQLPQALPLVQQHQPFNQDYNQQLNQQFNQQLNQQFNQQLNQQLNHQLNQQFNQQLNQHQVQVQQLPNQQAVNFNNQYQVNEFHSDQQNNDHPNQFGQQSYYAPDPDQKLNQNQFSDLANLVNNANVLPQGASFGIQPAILASQQNIVSPPGLLSQQELLQILNSIPQQHLVDSYGTPLVQQPQLQQHFTQQQAHQSAPVPQVSGLNNQFQQEFLNQVQSEVSQSVKNNFKPQFHTFNYEEQGRNKNVPNDFAQSRVTGDYSLEQETSENNPSVAIQSPNEALAQTQYVQQYFINSDDNNVVNENIVEQELPSDKDATRIFTQLASNGEVAPNLFFSSLPSREAAEALATLQAAGNVNSNLMKISQQNEQNTNTNQMRIYVPDEEESDDMDTSGEVEDGKEENQGQGIKVYETTYRNKTPENHKSKDSVEYEDYSTQQDEAVNSQNSGIKEEYSVKNSVSFGSRIKSKNDT